LIRSIHEAGGTTRKSSKQHIINKSELRMLTKNNAELQMKAKGEEKIQIMDSASSKKQKFSFP
jgi:hypothetical protein